MFLQGKSKDDEDGGRHGAGQLLMAMITQFVKVNGKNNIVGFTLSPSKVSSLMYALVLTAIYWQVLGHIHFNKPSRAVLSFCDNH